MTPSKYVHVNAKKKKIIIIQFDFHRLRPRPEKMREIRPLREITLIYPYLLKELPVII